MLQLEKKYCNLISMELSKYTVLQQNPFVANFRCYACKDSKKNPLKKRGYIMEKTEHLNYYCHNCGLSCSFDFFMKEYFEDQYSRFKIEKIEQYNVEQYNNIIHKTDVKLVENKFNRKSFELPSLDKLDEKHDAVKYVKFRKIPKENWKHILYSPSFFKMVNNKFIENKFTDNTLKKDNARIIFPFYDLKNNLIAFTGRAIDSKIQPRYIKIILDEAQDHYFYNINNVDFRKDFYILEGPIDSLFIPNSLAITGLSTGIFKFLDQDMNRKNNAVFIFDNQPRNLELLKQMKKVIDNGYRIMIWLSSIKEKDINELIMNNVTSKQIYDMIQENIFSNLYAKNAFNNWKKTN